MIITCHNVTSRRPTFLLKNLKVGTAVHLFQCLTTATARLLMERYEIPEEKIQVIHWCVDHDFFQPQGVPVIPNQICSAGMAGRDYATLIKAVKDLDIHVKIAADSPWFQHFLNINPRHLPERVEARSYQNYQALRQLYEESLFVVVPLLDVGYAAGYSVILEAMAMGKAVIATRIKQQDDFIIDGWSGFHVEPGDTAGLKKCIAYLLDHPEEAKRMGANGRKRVEENFTQAHYLQRMKEALIRVDQPC